jgi:hypothetical protein
MAADATAARFAARLRHRVKFAEAAVLARMPRNKRYVRRDQAKIIPSASPHANTAFYGIAAELSAWCSVLAEPIRYALAGTQLQIRLAGSEGFHPR